MSGFPVTIALVSNDNRAVTAQASYPHGEAEWLALDDGERQEFIDEAIAEHFLVLANGKSLAEWNEYLSEVRK